MQTRKKILAVLADADGCVLNPLAECLLFHVIANYHDVLYQYGRSAESYARNKVVIDEKLTAILSELEQIVGYQPGKRVTINGLKPVTEVVNQILLHLGYNNPENIDKDDVEIILNDAKRIYRQYLRQMGPLGQKVLDEIVLCANKPIISETVSRAVHERFDSLSLLCGSNRQSKSVDDLNSEDNANGSFFPVLMTLQNKLTTDLAALQSELACDLDTFLLADVYGQVPPGASFSQILKSLMQPSSQQEDDEFYEYVFDQKKFSLLYAMLHHLASKFPNDEITLMFFDDREDIHLALAKAFAENRDLMPHNVVIEFWPYDGNLPVNRHIRTEDTQGMNQGEIVTLRGTGEIDHNYYENVRRIASLSGYDEETQPSIDSTEQMNFAEFRKQRQLSSVVTTLPVDVDMPVYSPDSASPSPSPSTPPPSPVHSQMFFGSQDFQRELAMRLSMLGAERTASQINADSQGENPLLGY